MQSMNTISNVRSTQEPILVVSYDIYGDEREIETYLFESKSVTKETACALRQTYEALVNDDCKNDVQVFEVSFEDWVFQQGIWCIKVTQYRVEPVERGINTEYNALCIEQGI